MTYVSETYLCAHHSIESMAENTTTTQPNHLQQTPRKPPTTTLVQSKLTSAFFRPVKSTSTSTSTSTPTRSPYFAIIPSSESITPTAPTAPDDHCSSGSRSSETNSPPSATAAAAASTTTTAPPTPPPLNLYPERRAPLRLNRPPPSLPSTPSTTASTLLSLVASETKLLLPSLLSSAPHAPPTGHLYHRHNLPPLCAAQCPQLARTAIEVQNADSIDAALALTFSRPSPSSSAASTPTNPTNPPILILNMANAQHGGGGWLKGALAQEESLCYRSSLSFTLKRHFYPLANLSAIYSPNVLVLRDSLAAGHNLLDLKHPNNLPLVSIVSVAAVRDPEVIGGQGEDGRYRYAGTRRLMKEKMRVVLRVAAARAHRVLVLGALGCGAFGNPRGEVVACWREVFEEKEFGGGWWEKVVFAVLEHGGDEDGEGNFGMFWRGLDGLVV